MAEAAATVRAAAARRRRQEAARASVARATSDGRGVVLEAAVERARRADLPAAEVDAAAAELERVLDDEKQLRERRARQRVTELLVAASAGARITSVSAGAHGCYAVGDGHAGALAWGRGELGELGVEHAAALTEDEEGDLFSLTPLPARFPGPPIAVVELSACVHVLGRTADGALFAWGPGANGVLGLGLPMAAASAEGDDDDDDDDALGGDRIVPRPTRVAAVPPVHSIAACESHSVAAAVDGSVYTWGLRRLGRLGLADADADGSPGALGA